MPSVANAMMMIRGKYVDSELLGALFCFSFQKFGVDTVADEAGTWWRE